MFNKKKKKWISPNPYLHILYFLIFFLENMHFFDFDDSRVFRASEIDTGLYGAFH